MRGRVRRASRRPSFPAVPGTKPAPFPGFIEPCDSTLREQAPVGSDGIAPIRNLTEAVDVFSRAQPRDYDEKSFPFRRCAARERELGIGTGAVARSAVRIQSDRYSAGGGRYSEIGKDRSSTGGRQAGRQCARGAQLGEGVRPVGKNGTRNG